MMELPAHIQKAVDRFLPVTVGGVTLYPITVDEIDLFSACRPALEFLVQSLPVTLMQIPLLEAFYKIEMTNLALRTEDPNTPILDPLRQTALLLLLALRLGRGETESERLARVFLDEEGGRLNALIFRADDGSAVTVTPKLFQRLRPILAAQNGVELEPLDANPEIVLAERAILVAKAPKVILKPANKVSWLAVKCGCEEAEIYDWPILKFERRAEVIKLDENYVACMTGQYSGLVKFENGSPFPSPYYALDAEVLKTREIGSIGNGAAARAVAAATKTQKE